MRDLLSDDESEDDLRPQTPPPSLHVCTLPRDHAASPPRGCSRSRAGRPRGPKNRALQNVLECRAAEKDAYHWEKRAMLLTKQLEREQTKMQHEQGFRRTLLERFDETEDVKRMHDISTHQAKVANEKLRRKVVREKQQQRRAIQASRLALLTKKQHQREAEQFRQRERHMELATKREAMYQQNKTAWSGVQSDRQAAYDKRKDHHNRLQRRAKHNHEEKHRRIEEEKRAHRLQAEDAMARSSQLSHILDCVRAARAEQSADSYLSPQSLRRSLEIDVDLDV